MLVLASSSSSAALKTSHDPIVRLVGAAIMEASDDYVAVSKLKEDQKDEEALSMPQALPSTGVSLPEGFDPLTSPFAIRGSSRGNTRSRKIPKGEKNVAIGVQQKIPWMSMPNNQVLRVVQDFQPATLVTTSATVPTFFAIAFVAASLDNFANFAAVYDQYRITRIQALIYNDGQNLNSLPTMFTAVDLDDASAPTTVAQLGGYSSCVSSTGWAQHFHDFKPKFAIAAYSGTFSSYSSSEGWIDCGYPNVQYYGVKGAFPSAANTTTVSMLTRVEVEFRNLH